ncbi:MAG TPA: hypothetical protein ENG61_03535 [Candidatus Korarchaeota archaeon]|nr:hypothetical protein [Candidatus Korarchaeota archaeon]
MLKKEGEFLWPEAYHWDAETIVAEQAADGFNMNLIKYSLKVKKAREKHLKVFKQYTVPLWNWTGDMVLLKFREGGRNGRERTRDTTMDG